MIFAFFYCIFAYFFVSGGWGLFLVSDRQGLPEVLPPGHPARAEAEPPHAARAQRPE